MTTGRYLVLAAIVVCSTLGDYFLKVGMNQMETIRLNEPAHLLFAMANPWIILGTAVLIGFFVSFITALSWADLSYVMPATALGYVLTALLSATLLHEHVSVYRWTGVILISLGVGVVTAGPARTVNNEAAANGGTLSREARESE